MFGSYVDSCVSGYRLFTDYISGSISGLIGKIKRRFSGLLCRSFTSFSVGLGEKSRV